MLPRTRSIFHLGEVGGEEADQKSIITSIKGSPSPGSLVGLGILIQHQGTQQSNIVLKSALRPHRPCRSPKNLGFLKACHFCMRELSLEKEVYMYRGDQGFCSAECRDRQILLDERREFEESRRERLRAPQHRPKNREADHRRIPISA